MALGNNYQNTPVEPKYEPIEQNIIKPQYEKPLFEKQSGMEFPMQILEELNGGRFCLQCSSCHGCR